MATFKEQVQSLTGLTISNTSTDPLEDELTQYLQDGVYEVTSRIISIRPQDIDLFQTVSDVQSNNNSYSVKGKIINVVREAGVEGDWRKCRKVPAFMEGRVADEDSLEFASKYNPVYLTLENGKISVYPAPSSSVNQFKVIYVSNDPKRDSDAATLAHSSSDIRNFPKNKYYLVVLYASIKSLQQYLATFKDPAVGGSNEELTGTITSGTIGNASDQLDVSDWWDVAGDLIETEEDPELAQMQIEKLRTYLTAWQSQLQGNTTEYSWMAQRMQLLQVQYDTAFGVMAPKESRAPQQRGR